MCSCIKHPGCHDAGSNYWWANYSTHLCCAALPRRGCCRCCASCATCHVRLTHDEAISERTGTRCMQHVFEEAPALFQPLSGS
jgi:hypothetical protein